MIAGAGRRLLVMGSWDVGLQWVLTSWSVIIGVVTVCTGLDVRWTKVSTVDSFMVVAVSSGNKGSALVFR